MNIENTAHFVMQSKGGAGKSVVSSMLAQYLQDKNDDIILIDTDPSNKTLGSYKGLNVQKIEVLNKNKLVDQSKFDGFINEFLESNQPMLVDTGSGDFLAINGYMLQNEIPDVFIEMGKNIIIHVPVNFNQSRDETFKCLIEISTNHPNVGVVVWENEFFGENDKDALAPLIKKLGNIIGVIKIRAMNKDTEEKDFASMLQNSMTFKEVAECEDKDKFGFIQKTRVKRLKNEIWYQLDQLFNDTVENDQSKNKSNKTEK